MKEKIALYIRAFKQSPKGFWNFSVLKAWFTLVKQVQAHGCSH